MPPGGMARWDGRADLRDHAESGQVLMEAICGIFPGFAAGQKPEVRPPLADAIARSAFKMLDREGWVMWTGQPGSEQGM